MTGQASLLDDLESVDDIRADLARTRRLWTISQRDGLRELVRVVRIDITNPGHIEDVTDRVARLCELRTVAGRILAVAGGIAPCHQITLHLTRALSTPSKTIVLEVAEL